MRIRSIKPNFWRSLDITALDWDARLIFIGLWSYVDDNGVGLDRLSVIAADLFADDVEREPRETFARVSRGLQTLSDGGLIVRYEADAKPLLFVTKWDDHQKIDRPGAVRYPRPPEGMTSANAADSRLFATPSRDTRDTLAAGEGEKGRRGTEDKGKEQTPRPPAAPASFDAFWSAYPRKDDKIKAQAAYGRAVKKATPAAILAGAQRYAADPNRDPAYTKHPTTWLNAGSWENDPLPPPPVDRRPGKPTADDKIANTLAIGRQMDAAANNGRPITANHHAYPLELTS